LQNKRLDYFVPKNCYSALTNMGLGSVIRAMGSEKPGSRDQKSIGSSIRNTG